MSDATLEGSIGRQPDHFQFRMLGKKSRLGQAGKRVLRKIREGLLAK